MFAITCLFRLLQNELFVASHRYSRLSTTRKADKNIREIQSATALKHEQAVLPMMPIDQGNWGIWELSKTLRAYSQIY